MNSIKLVTPIFAFLAMCIACADSGTNSSPESALSYQQAPIMQRLDTTFTEIDFRKTPIVVDTFPADKCFMKFTPITLQKREYIGLVNKMLFPPQHIVVVDREVGQKIDIFTRNGEWVAKIDRKGRSREEYIKMYDAVYSDVDSCIVVDAGLTLVYYNLKGEFVKRVETGYGMWIATFGDKIVKKVGDGQTFSADTPHHLSVSIGDSILWKGLKHDPIHSYALIMNNRGFSKTSRNELLFHTPYCDTIYQLHSASTYFAKYAMKFEKSLWEFADKRFTDSPEKFLKNGYKSLVDPFFETDNWLLLHYNFADMEQGVVGQRSVYFNKGNDKLYDLSGMFALGPIITDPYVNGLYTACVGINGNNFVGYLPKATIDELLEFLKKNPQIKKINKEFFDVAENTKNLEGIMFECNYTL